MRARTLATLFVLAVAVLAQAACGGGGSSSSEGAATTTSSSSTSAAGGGKTLALAADPNGALKYDKSSLEASSGTVTIDFTNDSSLLHNVTIKGNGIDEVASDTVTQAKSSVTADLPPGTYTFFCSVDAHEAGGMKGTLTVK